MAINFDESSDLAGDLDRIKNANRFVQTHILESRLQGLRFRVDRGTASDRDKLTIRAFEQLLKGREDS